VCVTHQVRQEYKEYNEDDIDQSLFGTGKFAELKSAILPAATPAPPLPAGASPPPLPQTTSITTASTAVTDTEEISEGFAGGGDSRKGTGGGGGGSDGKVGVVIAEGRETEGPGEGGRGEGKEQKELVSGDGLPAVGASMGDSVAALAFFGGVSVDTMYIKLCMYIYV
jgi:hypothetical protein